MKNTLINNILDNSFVVLLARIIIGLMFVIVGVGKIAHPAEFADEIANYQILPNFFINIAAITIPWIELIAGILVIFGIKQKPSATIILLMLIVFTSGVAVAMAKGLNIDCGCYSQIASQQVGIPKILENTGLMILSIIIILTNNKKFILQSE